MLLVSDLAERTLSSFLRRYGLEFVKQDAEVEITGSFWGESEAGIVGRSVYVRADTPIHSLLHETCHVICMTEERRTCLDRDAGGGDLEESAACYLQVVLAGHIDGVGRDQLMLDMDAWGTVFALETPATGSRTMPKTPQSFL